MSSCCNFKFSRKLFIIIISHSIHSFLCLNRIWSLACCVLRASATPMQHGFADTFGSEEDIPEVEGWVNEAHLEAFCWKWVLPSERPGLVQELCESRGGRPGLSVLTSLLVSVDVKLYWTMLRHWSQLVPNMSTGEDIKHHFIIIIIIRTSWGKWASSKFQYWQSALSLKVSSDTMFRLDGWVCGCSWAMLVTLTYINNTTRPWWKWERVYS